jgi:hypothetical protein
VGKPISCGPSLSIRYQNILTSEQLSLVPEVAASTKGMDICHYFQGQSPGRISFKKSFHSEKTTVIRSFKNHQPIAENPLVLDQFPVLRRLKHKGALGHAIFHANSMSTGKKSEQGNEKKESKWAHLQPSYLLKVG